MDDNRRLLDELMGKQRDIPDEEKKEMKFYDATVDKMWICGCQPYNLFNNTPWFVRLDANHRTALARDADPQATEQPQEAKDQWDALSQSEKDKYGYEHDLYSFLGELVKSSDRQIARLKEQHEIYDGLYRQVKNKLKLGNRADNVMRLKEQKQEYDELQNEICDLKRQLWQTGDAPLNHVSERRLTETD